MRSLECLNSDRAAADPAEVGRCASDLSAQTRRPSALMATIRSRCGCQNARGLITSDLRSASEKCGGWRFLTVMENGHVGRF
jgi:hypothetical protein